MFVTGSQHVPAGRRLLSTFLALAGAGLASAAAQQMPPTPVGYAVVVEREIRQTLELTGNVSSRRSGLMASEVAGLVVELAAREGDRVERGQVIVRLRAESARLRLASAEGELGEARAQLRLAETKRARARELYAEQVVSRQQLDDAISEFDAAEARVARLEADLERLADDLERTVVRAPYRGVVVREHTAVGEWIGAGDPVVEIVDTSDLEVTVEVPEAFYGGLRVGAPVQITISALGDDVYDGSIRAIVPRADPQARTFPVKIAVPNPEGRIGIGMLARAVLSVGAAEKRVLVPKDAIVGSGARTSVFIIGDGEQVRAVPVRTERSQGQWTAVAGEVAAGDRVVVQGNERLMPGQTVAPSLREVTTP